MKDLKRQDRNGTRNSEELRRRYKFNEIKLTKEEVEYLKSLIVVDSALSTTSTNPVQNKVITNALNNKVNIEEGKGLSSNDFTNILLDKLNQIEDNAEANIIESISVNGVLQTITDKNIDIEVQNYTETDKEQVQANTEARHTHSNKDLLDTYTQTEGNLKNAVDNTHAHSNKGLLDTYTQTEEDLSNAVINIHTHSNKNVLDSYTLTEEELLERISPVNVSEYSFYIVTTENTTTIPITYEEYIDGDIVDVYINGSKLIKGLHFSISENNIVLTNEVDVVGTEIEIVIKKYN